MRVLLYVLAVLALVTGCAHRDGVVQGQDKSYFWFTGNTKGAVVRLNDLAPMVLGDASGVKDTGGIPKSKDTLYEVAPGKYTVIVERDGGVVVNRAVLVGAGMTKEVRVP